MKTFIFVEILLSKMLRENYKKKIIYVTPGAGKTTLTQQHPYFIDADEIIKDVIHEFHPEFPILQGQSIQEYIRAFTETFKYKTKINNEVTNRSKQFVKQGFTVLIGTLKIAQTADHVFLIKPENTRVLSRFGNLSDSTKFYEAQIDYFRENDISYHILERNIEDELFTA